MGIKKAKQNQVRTMTYIKNKIAAKRPIAIPYFLPYKDIIVKRKGEPILLQDNTYADLLNLPLIVQSRLFLIFIYYCLFI